MKSYTIRSFMIVISFLNFIIHGFATWLYYREGFIITSPFLRLFLCVYFLILTVLIVGHKKNHTTAMNNNIIMSLFLSLLIFINMFIKMNLSVLKGNFFILLSLISIIYLAIIHEGISFKSYYNRLKAYILESKKQSSFIKYLTIELASLIILTIAFYTFLKF
jgi:hypothetical protein